MKTKTLAQIDGIIGLITGIILAILPFVIVMIAGISEDEDAAAVIVGMMFIAFALVKIAILILGILTLIYYKDDKRITLAPSILFIVGAVVSLIPFLGWIGGGVIDSIFRVDWRYCHYYWCCTLPIKFKTISNTRIDLHKRRTEWFLLFLILENNFVKNYTLSLSRLDFS